MFIGDLAGTGFGSVTSDLGKALLDLGHDVRFVSQNELGTLPEPFASRTFQVNDADGWLSLKQKGIAGLLTGAIWPDKWVPEAALLLSDFYGALEVVTWTEEARQAFSSIPVLHYVPIEGVDLPPTWNELWQIIHPVAMSEFGVDQIERVTGQQPPMVYHGIDTTQFRPVTQLNPLWINDKPLRSKRDCKKFFGGDPDAKWLFRADRNMPRKRYASLFRSIAPVLASHRNTFMVVHCRDRDEGGILSATIAKYPDYISSRILNTGFHDQVGGASRNILTALYNAADVYVSVSAEGFGLTIAEAIACGTPAVGIDYSSVPEVIGPAGLIAPIAGIIDNEWDHFWAAVDERAYPTIVSKILDDDILRTKLGREGPDHVRSKFQWSHAAVQFAQIIEERLAQRAAA